MSTTTSSKWPLLPVTTVGSWPRPHWLLDATRKGSRRLAEYRDDATLLAIKLQEDAGADIVTDGEQRRDNFYSFLAERLDGLRLMSMAELLEFVEDKAAFETQLRALDVPAYAIKNPTVVGRLERNRPLVLDDVRFLREHTKKPVKATLPGPYLLSRSMWVKGLSADAYPERGALVDDIVRILREELLELAAAGVDVVQFDEPVLTELAFAGKAATRTFMCAALAAAASPEGELELAVECINRVVEGVDGPLIGVHVCRGNWSQDESVLLSGSYEPLLPYLERMRVDQYVLEYATPRAGPIDLLRSMPGDRAFGLGVVNPRTLDVEPVLDVRARIAHAVEVLGAERLHVNPDCGFGTFADRPVAASDVAFRKQRSLAEAVAPWRR